MRTHQPLHVLDSQCYFIRVASNIAMAAIILIVWTGIPPLAVISALRLVVRRNDFSPFDCAIIVSILFSLDAFCVSVDPAVSARVCIPACRNEESEMEESESKKSKISMLPNSKLVERQKQRTTYITTQDRMAVPTMAEPLC